MRKECIIDNKLVKVISNGSNVNIVFLDDLTSINWGDFWSDIRSFIFNSPILKCVNINLEHCLHADPFPMMSILLELIKLKKEYKININIIIPSILSNDFDKKNYKRAQFLKYLATQGFLKIMLDNFSVKNQKMILKDDVIEKYSAYANEPLFPGEVIVPVQIYEVDDENKKQEILDSILDLFMFSFKNKVGLHTYNYMRGDIYNITNELIENSIKHAYEESEIKRFAVYIRNIRAHNDVKTNLENINGFRKHEIYKEKNNCPAIDTQIYMDNSAFLEIYFIDIGMGMRNSLKEYYFSENKDYKYPVRELFYKVLKDGIRKSNSSSVTPFGGLHFICRVISENNGYIWCNEGIEWVGASSARLLKDGINSTQIALSKNSDTVSSGLNWCFRIPYNDFDTNSRTGFYYKWRGVPKNHPIYQVYSEKEEVLNINQLLCLDERKDQSVLMNGEYFKWQCEPISVFNSDDTIINARTLVWIPKLNYTKNQISRRIREYLGHINSRLQNNKLDLIIIGDIESNELISYYYAFNQNSTETLGSKNIKKVMLITNKWELVCFQNINGFLTRSKEEEERYFSSQIHKEIYNSIKQYGRFIRTYDSYCFWQWVKRHEIEKIYLNAKINWGQQTFWGYLDLIRLHLHNDLYEIVRNSLIRISGFIENTNIEYRNIDQSVERLCQDINADISLQNSVVTPIDVCGACVTGYTKDSYYSDSDFALSVILFLHPTFNRRIDDVAILFIWPQNEFFNDFPVDNDSYHRLGKTCFITSEVEENLINLSTIYDNVVRNKIEMYEDFQAKVPQFIRYGHYKTDNHHYLIGFDFISYMKHSYMKKEGAFLYFLWKIIYYLVGENVESYYSLLKDKQWEAVLRKCRYKKDSNHGDIVIYHSNTFTEYVMRLIKTIVPNDMATKIVPLNIVKLQDKGGPLAFSPLVMKKVKNKFEDNNSRGILYIDSSFSTGRRMLEIENAFLAAGCKKVSFLTILDMRRLRNRDSKNNSYWKVNIPRLDDDGHCVICDTFKKIEDYEKKTDSEFNERLSEWRKNWSCMNVNNSIGEHGIEMEEDLSCKFDRISIRDSTNLNMIVAEKVCESYNNDFVYTYITSIKTDLKAFIRMQLICTQILLFGNQYSRKLQLSLLSEIISILAKSPEVNTYTSLAGIVLISQKAEVMYELLNEILYLNQVPKIKQIKGYLLSAQNKDLAIAIGYFVKSNYLIEELLNSFPNKNTSKFIEMVNDHMVADKDLKLLFKEFEGLYINEMGSRHNTNTQKLIQEHSDNYDNFVTRCNQVLNDMNELMDLSIRFPTALVNSKNTSEFRRQNINEMMANLKLAISNQQNEYSIQKNTQDITQFVANESVKKAVRDCESFFDRIINSYFISYDTESINYFKNYIEQYEKKYGKQIKIRIICESTPPNTYKQYYWNASIEKEFLYLLENLEHCNTSIDGNNMMSVDVLFQSNNLLIKLVSWSDIASYQVKDAFFKKNRLSKEQSIAFDVIFEFSHAKINNETGEFLLESTMSIPACYPQLKGEVKK